MTTIRNCLTKSSRRCSGSRRPISRRARTTTTFRTCPMIQRWRSWMRSATSLTKFRRWRNQSSNKRSLKSKAANWRTLFWTIRKSSEFSRKRTSSSICSRQLLTTSWGTHQYRKSRSTSLASIKGHWRGVLFAITKTWKCPSKWSSRPAKRSIKTTLWTGRRFLEVSWLSSSKIVLPMRRTTRGPRSPSMAKWAKRRLGRLAASSGRSRSPRPMCRKLSSIVSLSHSTNISSSIGSSSCKWKARRRWMWRTSFTDRSSTSSRKLSCRRQMNERILVNCWWFSH